jgi:DNA-binding NarL/FixJ family response regulator
MKPVRILHADDHSLFSQGLHSLIKEVEGYQWLGNTTTLEATLKSCQRLKPDILLLDYFFPDGNGLDTAAIIREKFPDIRIIFLTMQKDLYIMEKSRAIGVQGYLLKNIQQEQLIDALHQVQKGLSFFMWDLSEKETTNESDKLGRLSERERQIVLLVSMGMTSSAIAQKLNLSEFTVSTHRRNILRKLEIKNAAQLSAIATLLSGQGN